MEPWSWGNFSKKSWYAVAVSRVNGMVINCSWLPLQQILIKFDVMYFSNLANYHVSSSWIFMSQWNFLKLEIGMLVNLLGHWNGFQDFNILNFRKTLLKFAIVFKIFEYFCPFLSLTIKTGQQGFWSLAVGLLDITAETEISFEHFHREIWKLFS